MAEGAVVERLTRRLVVAFDLDLVPPPAASPELEVLIERGLNGLAFPLGDRLARITGDVQLQSITEPRDD